MGKNYGGPKKIFTQEIKILNGALDWTAGIFGEPP
jgi:hypothetical protein